MADASRDYDKGADEDRPSSARESPREGLLSGEPPPPPLRRESSLDRGIVGTPPPLVRDSDHIFTAAEVERLLAAREKEALSLKRRLHRASKKGEFLESRVSGLKEEASGLRRAAQEVVVERDTLQIRVSELEGSVKRKVNALKTAGQRRERAEENAASEAAQAREAAQLARATLDEAGRKGQAYRESVKDAQTRIKALELRLEATEAKASETQREATVELAIRKCSQEQERASLKAIISAAQEENRSTKAKLDEALRGLREKQEAERETDKVILKLQAWRERVATGDIVEMSPSEAKRLRWSEEQAELLREANANLRSELIESGRLLTEAEHSFATVTAGFGDAGATIADLSASLSLKKKEFLNTESALEASRSEASKLKKCVVSLQLGLSEQQRVVRGRERAIDSTQKSMEALVRGRQEEVEAKKREAGRRRAAEGALGKAAGELESLRQRADAADERSREFDAERRVLLEHLAAARREVASARLQTAGNPSSSSTKATLATPDLSGAGENTARVGSWRETTRSLLERAVSDWSVKKLFRSVAVGNDGMGCHSEAASKERLGHSSSDSYSSSSSRECSRNASPDGLIGDGASVKGCGLKSSGLTATTASVPPDTGRGRLRGRKRRNVGRGDVNSVMNIPSPLEVLRVYGAPNGEGTDRTAGWRWDLVNANHTEGGSHGTGDMMAVLGLHTLGRSLRARGVRGEGARVALSAVARVLHALLLTRRLAAQQCAEARTELALAIARLSSRGALVSDTREASRRAFTCNRTLVLRLVDAELRCWRWRRRVARRVDPSAGTADEIKGVIETSADGDGARHPHSNITEDPMTNPDDKRHDHPRNRVIDTDDDMSTSCTSTDGCGEHNPPEIRNFEEEAADRGSHSDDDGNGKRRLKRKARIKPRPAGEGKPNLCLREGGGVTLDLRDVGLDDEILLSVARKISRWHADRTPRSRAGEASDEQTHGAEHREKSIPGLQSAAGAVPLRSLLLSGNNVTDAGVSALVPMVESSACLVDIDLRGNAISTKGARTLRKALARNPSVRRLTSEDVCPNDPEKGKTSAGGVILRARRRQDSTPVDRARAYAFKRIPPSAYTRSDGTAAGTDGEGASKQIPTQPGPCSSSEEKPGVCGGLTDECADGNRRAPAHGGSVGNTGRRHQGLRLTPSSTAAIAAGTAVQVVAPWCKIDLRGCWKRPPPPLPLAAAEHTPRPEGRSLPVTPTSAAGAGKRSNKRVFGTSGARCRSVQGRGRKVGGNWKAGTPVERLEAVSGPEPAAHLAQTIGKNAGPAVFVGALPLGHRLRDARRGKAVSQSAGVDGVGSPKSEVEDIDELASLLSVSRRIFRKARGLHDVESPPRKGRCALDGGSFKERRAAAATQRGRGRPGALSSARVQREERGNARGPENCRNGDRTAASSTDKMAISSSVEEVEGPQGVGEGNGATDSEDGSSRGRAARAVSIGEAAGAQPALGEQAPGAIRPAVTKPNEKPDLSAEKLPCVSSRAAVTGTTFGANADECANESLPQSHRMSEDGVPLVDAGGEQLLLEEGGRGADIGTAEFAAHGDGSGWLYDEATESWYAATNAHDLANGGEVGAGENGGGWHYDEQSATWYQDGPKEEPSCVVQEPEQTAIANSPNEFVNLDEMGGNAWATAEDHEDANAEAFRRDLSSTRLAAVDDGRKEASYSIDLAGVKVNGRKDKQKTVEAGDLVAKRIEALRLALRARR